MPAALPRHRLGFAGLLLVVDQTVARGLRYGNLQQLRTYVGRPIRVGQLPGMVAEIAALFGPAYARLRDRMRQPAPIQAADSERMRFHRRLHALYLEMGLAREQVQADPVGRERVYDELRTDLHLEKEPSFCMA